jgi:hypothetical protein
MLSDRSTGMRRRVSVPVRAPQLGQILAAADIWAPHVLHFGMGPVLSA